MQSMRIAVAALSLGLAFSSAVAQTRESPLTNLRSDRARLDSAGPPCLCERSMLSGGDDRTVTMQIRFDREKAAITPEARALLDQKMTLLRTNPNLAIEVQAEDGATPTLGQRRAQAAMRYLVANGIDARRIHVSRARNEVAPKAERDAVDIVMAAARP